MGNCMCMSSQTTPSWSEDDWGAFSPKHRKRTRTTLFQQDNEGGGDGEREGLLGELRTMTSSFPGGSSSEIKIRMTKKDLEDLLRRINLKGLTAEEVLDSLITDGADQLVDSDRTSHQRPWRPTLQSIPEVD